MCLSLSIGPSSVFKIVKMIMERNFQPVIIFSFSKKECEAYALQVAKLDFNKGVYASVFALYLYFKHMTSECVYRHVLKYAVRPVKHKHYDMYIIDIVSTLVWTLVQSDLAPGFFVHSERFTSHPGTSGSQMMCSWCENVFFLFFFPQWGQVVCQAGLTCSKLMQAVFIQHKFCCFNCDNSSSDSPALLLYLVFILQYFNFSHCFFLPAYSSSSRGWKKKSDGKMINLLSKITVLNCGFHCVSQV